MKTALRLIAATLPTLLAHGQEVHTIKLLDQPTQILISTPMGRPTDERRPMVLALTESALDSAEAARKGMPWFWDATTMKTHTLVCPMVPLQRPHVEALLVHLRSHYRITGCRPDLITTGKAVTTGVEIVQSQPWQFRCFAPVTPTEPLPQKLDVVTFGTGPVPAASAHLRLDAVRLGMLPKGEPAAAHLALDEFNDAASRADADTYFGLMTEDHVFLGTDPKERWTKAEFEGFARKYFERDSAWIYVPTKRHVSVGPGGAFAWFDETVHNASYGECRGTGVLVRSEDGSWRIAQYSLSVPIPNALTREVVKRIDQLARDGK